MRVAVIDDVPQEADATRALVERAAGAASDLGSAGADAETADITLFSSGSEFLDKYPRGHGFDVIFLDIEMPGLDGMETARKIRDYDTNVIIIFTTRMAQYAVAGYAVDAISYLVKPIAQPEFELAWRKVQRILSARTSMQVPIESTTGTIFLNSDDILYVDVRSHMLYYHTTRGTYTAWKSLTAAAEELKDYDFAVISRYVMVSIAHVTKIDTSTGDIDVEGEVFRVSRSKKKEVAQRLLDFHARG